MPGLLTYKHPEHRIKLIYGGGNQDIATQCSAKGGVWDPLTLTCKMPDKETRDPINSNNTSNSSNSGKHGDNYVVGVPVADGNQWGFTSLIDAFDGGGAGHSGDTYSDGIWGDGGSPGHRNGSSDDNSYITGVPKADGNQWGFTGIKDMFDGGGAGHSGDTYSDGIWGDGGSPKGGSYPRRSYNMGGNVPMYANDGTLVNHPFNREGEEFDTVDARLTPGEYVIDADSTHVFKGLLDKVNQWEPGDSKNLGGLLSKKGEKMVIKKEMQDGTKLTMESGVESENDMMPMLSAVSGGQPMMQPQQQGYNLGGLLQDYQARRNARIGANARADAGRLTGGLTALGSNIDNSLAQIGSAGLRTNSLGSYGPGGYQGANFSSRNAPATNYGKQLSAIGQGEQVAANAVKQYRDELTGINTQRAEADSAQAVIDKAEQDKVDKEQKVVDAELKVIAGLRDKALQAYNLVDLAAPGLKILAKAGKLSSIIKEYTGGLGKTIGNIVEGGSILTANPQTLEYLVGQHSDLALGKAVEDKKLTQSQASAARNVVSLATDITAAALKAQGSGVKTDFDFLVAERSVANLKDNPETIKSSFKRLVDDANVTLKETSTFNPVAPVAAPVVAPEEVKPEVVTPGVVETVTDKFKDLKWSWK